MRLHDCFRLCAILPPWAGHFFFYLLICKMGWRHTESDCYKVRGFFENVLNLMMVMVAQHFEYWIQIELYTLNG